ncbi:MAG: hypothetical protein AAF417_17065, partial [Pseudomonadota bacterium]
MRTQRFGPKLGGVKLPVAEITLAMTGSAPHEAGRLRRASERHDFVRYRPDTVDANFQHVAYLHLAARVFFKQYRAVRSGDHLWAER